MAAAVLRARTCATRVTWLVAALTAPKVPLELPRDRLSGGLGQLDGVLGLLELRDVLGDLFVLLGELVDPVLLGSCVVEQVAERDVHAEEVLELDDERERRLG